MKLDQVEKIANAVLYEGYILYPYRPSTVKNRQRFSFGALYPESYSVAQRGAERFMMQTECLVEGDASAQIDVKARFLHLVSREIGRLSSTLSELPEQAEPVYETVPALEAGDEIFQTWQEAVERDVRVENLKISDAVGRAHRETFAFPSKREIEPLRETDGKIVGVIVRRRRMIEGAIEISAASAGERLYKLTVRVLNLTPHALAAKSADEDSTYAHRQERDEALLQTLASTHAILRVREGAEFVSLLDPPEGLREAVASCKNEGVWPVMVGEEGERSMLLASPIILYDYPQIAPESAGDLFDGTEIDEILTLRIMTLTDEEKREMRSVDERARKILERTETLLPEQLMKLHGAVRSLRPSKGEDV